MRYLLLLTFCFGCQSGHLPNSDIPLIMDDIPSRGRTSCGSGNQPTIVLNKDSFFGRPIVDSFGKLTINGINRESIIAHEMVHVRQMEAFPGGCNQFSKKYGLSPMFRLKTEIEAFCGQINFLVRYGAHEQTVKSFVAKSLSSNYSLPYSKELILQALDCVR